MTYPLTRRELLRTAAVLPAGAAWGGRTRPESIALETYARRSYNYYNRMVDRDGLPYFNIFWTSPAEAAHDWPDFGDVSSRQLQAVIMGRRMIGETCLNESIWLRRILSLIDPSTGLLARPETPYSKHTTDMGDQALTLYTLATAYLDSTDPSLAKAVRRMVDGIGAWAAERAAKGRLPDYSFSIKSLMVCARLMDYQPALALAGRFSTQVLASGLFTIEDRIRNGGHVHGTLRALVGLADYALHTRDERLFARVDAIYRNFRDDLATRFGFIPEVVARKGEVVATETCALMDYVGLAVTLAEHGHPEYWADVERIVRNQLIESQAHDLSWVTSDAGRADTDEFSWRDLSARLEGAYAGWSSPTHFLAAEEYLHWGGPKLRNKVRLFQNCCGGSGTHAFFIAWKSAARFERDTLSVRLHLDKLLPQAEIRSGQPYQGLLHIRLKRACGVRVRIPDFVEARAMRVTSGRDVLPFRVDAGFLDLGQRPDGESILVRYSLPVKTESVSIGNPGFRQYRYRVTWKGDTAVRMEPAGIEQPTGYSDFEKRDVPVYYGAKGPGPLYQRAHMIHDAEPAPAPLHADDGSLNLW